MKAHHVGAVLCEHTVEDERMDVDVEIQRAAPGSPLRRLCAVGWKSLDDRDRAAAAVRHAVSARAAAQETEHRSEIHGHDRPTEVVIPGEEIPNPMRQAQHPLPHGHVGKDVIDQVGSAFGHPAPTAARTESAPASRSGWQFLRGLLLQRARRGRSEDLHKSPDENPIRSPCLPALGGTRPWVRFSGRPRLPRAFK